MYAKVNNGVVQHYPYADQQIISDNPSVTFPSELTHEDRLAWGAVLIEDSPPEFNSRREVITKTEPTSWPIEDGVIKVGYTKTERPVSERRGELISVIEGKRWDVEVGGMTFNGVQVPTDDRSKTLILGARTAAIEQGEAYYDEWKISPGVYVPLNAEAATALGDALLAHIRASFAREKVLSLAALAAEDHDALDLVEAEIDNDWPV